MLFEKHPSVDQNRYANEVYIKYAHSVTTAHVSNTSAHYYPHTKFRHCSLYRTLDNYLFVIC